jgi:hypothetical protein
MEVLRINLTSQFKVAMGVCEKAKKHTAQNHALRPKRLRKIEHIVLLVVSVSLFTEKNLVDFFSF